MLKLRPYPRGRGLQAYEISYSIYERRYVNLLHYAETIRILGCTAIKERRHFDGSSSTVSNAIEPAGKPIPRARYTGFI